MNTGQSLDIAGKETITCALPGELQRNKLMNKRGSLQNGQVTLFYFSKQVKQLRRENARVVFRTLFLCGN